MSADSEIESNFELNDEIVLLQSLWRTEFHSPEILPYQDELVENVKSLLDNQQVCYNYLIFIWFSFLK